MNELELIARLVPYLAQRSDRIVIGPGEDDAAAWRESDGTYTVASCDTSVERVHFNLKRQEPEDIGWRALAFALGDLAAKGAAPTYGLVAISIPSRWWPEEPERIYAGMGELAKEVGLLLVGGDTTSAPLHGSLTITVLGRTANRPRPRSEVQPGWKVAVTGPLGAASPAWKRPRPQLEKGRQLAERHLICGDISDGLVRELDKVSAASGVGARLVVDAVPVADGATRQKAITNGEEVELVCMGPEQMLDGLYVVGELTPERSVVVLDGEGNELSLASRGYDHFG